MHNIDTYSNQLNQKYRDLDNHILGIWGKVAPTAKNNNLELITKINQKTTANIATLSSPLPHEPIQKNSTTQADQIKKDSWFGRFIKLLGLKRKSF